MLSDLEGAGYVVEWAPEGDFAAETFAASKPRALILAAGEYPDGSAMDVHRALVLRFKALPPTLVLSERDTAREEAAWKGAKIARFIQTAGPGLGAAPADVLSWLTALPGAA